MGMDTNRVVLAAVLIGAGVVLLGLRFFGGFSGFLWPLFIVAPGLVLLALAPNAGALARTLAVLGAVVAGTGAILLVQDITDYYQSWAYAWALLPAVAGLALAFVGQHDGDAEGQATGWRLAAGGGAAFVILAAIFELFIFAGGLMDGGLVAPLVLIAIGALLLMRWPGGSKPPPPEPGA